MISFQQFQSIPKLLNAADGHVGMCEQALEAIAEASGKGRFEDLDEIAAEISTALPEIARQYTEPEPEKKDEVADDGERRMTLLNLMYAPRGSTLFSVANTLCQIETLSHICAWTKDVELKPTDSYSIDLIDLPRLKLVTTHDSRTSA